MHLYFQAVVPDGFYTPYEARETETNRVVLRATCTGWTHRPNSSVPAGLVNRLTEVQWRGFVGEVRSLDRFAPLIPWIDLLVHVLVVVILVTVILWNPVLREKKIMPLYSIFILFFSMLAIQLVLQVTLALAGALTGIVTASTAATPCHCSTQACGR